MLTVYTLPFMIGVTAAQFAYQTGAGFIGGFVFLSALMRLAEQGHSHFLTS
ncbi:hypothetical protein [Ensifer sp. NM-2]|uniref:hypothetical protein n=1 Tax=Ensifer sp. NM-2 TaxID=2109730 RepID=UPI0018EAA8C4|nr:hypothetical protein [Ensifer sp. NM-2]